jgi:hypothetical protein
MRSAGNFSPEWGYLAPVPSFARTARIVLVAAAIGATAGAGVVLSLVDRPAQPERTPVAARAIVTSARTTPAPAAPEISAAPATAAAAPVSGPAASPAPPAPSASPPSTIATSEVPGRAPARPQATPPAPSQPANAPTAVVPSAPDHQPVQASAAIVPPAKAEPPTVGQANTGQPNTGSTPATGIAALSEPSATGAAAPADAPDAGTPGQEPAPSQKKTKHHAAYGKTPFVGLGTLFRRFFVAHAGRSYYPNR